VSLGCVTAALLVVLLFSNTPRSYLKDLSQVSFLWLPPLAAFGLYVLDHVEDRFLGPFLLLLFAAAFISIRIPSTMGGRSVARSVCWAAALILGAQIGWVVLHGALRLATVHNFVDWDVSTALHSQGIREGDRVAAIGDVKAVHVWAYLAGVTIVSEVPEDGVSEFWATTPETRSQVFERFAQAGARAVVVENVPAPQAPDWLLVPGTDYYIHVLSR